ncbi:hypothetical protein T03_10983 [Trichinella britovi]|uniref:Uncharacterized protein n=1 Tax=Trichinella britovi TaxID=45882 RepID=A0A0V1B8N6_TRIBR|nr:hypothetical protein T03_10983 [Trichinella britovi]
MVQTGLALLLLLVDRAILLGRQELLQGTTTVGVFTRILCNPSLLLSVNPVLKTPSV